MIQLPQWSVYAVAYYADGDFPAKLVPLEGERLLVLQGADRQISILPDRTVDTSTKAYQFPYQFVTDATTAPAPYEFAYLWQGDRIRLIGNRYRRLDDAYRALGAGPFNGLLFLPRTGYFLAIAANHIAAFDVEGRRRFGLGNLRTDSYRVAVSPKTGDVVVAGDSGGIRVCAEDGSLRTRFDLRTTPARQIRSVAFDSCNHLWVGSKVIGGGDPTDPHQIWILDENGRQLGGFGVGDAGYGIWDPSPYGIVDARQIVGRGNEMLVLDAGMRRIVVYDVACGASGGP